MSLLDSLKRPGDRPVIMTITGEAGAGKTSLAATFPNPVFLQFEDGVQSIPEADRPMSTGLIQTVESLNEWFGSLYHEPHDYKTVVIDSLTAMDEVFKTDIMSRENEHNRTMAAACGGYGKAYGRMAEMHHGIRAFCQSLNTDRGMHIVVIAHSTTEKLDPPDSDGYTRYSINLNKNGGGDSQKHWVDNVDVVAFLKIETLIKGSDKGPNKAISHGKRVIDCTCKAANVSKNRYGIDKIIPFVQGLNPFVEYIPSLKGDENNV